MKTLFGNNEDTNEEEEILRKSTKQKRKSNYLKHAIKQVFLFTHSEVYTADVMQTIYLAGGCFWCTEAVFKSLKGVSEATPGYIGGMTANPTYEQICTGETGHSEAVKVVYDENLLKLSDLLEIFFATHVPTTLNRQGNDVGTQYRSAIFFTKKEQEEVVLESIKEAQKNFSDKIITEIVSATEFYPAEEYHRDYYFAHSNQAYCMLVISPKLEKLQKEFGDKLK